MSDKKKKTIKEALAFLNRMLSGEAAELNNLKSKVGKGWLTKGMYDNSADVYKTRRKEWNKYARDLKAGSITPESIYTKYGKKWGKYSGVKPGKSKSTLSWIDIAKGKGSRDERTDWKNERLKRIQDKKREKEEEENE